MDKEALKRIFEFLEEKEKHKVPFIFKVKCEIPFTKEELNIKGRLYLFDSEITSLPEGLKVSGDLVLSYSEKLNSLPKGLKVGGSLNLFHTRITSLPEGLKVGGGLNLAYCDNITSLPESLYVDGDLNIRYTPLTKYTDEELREMVKPGFIDGEIFR
jgi:hypothetical protein